MDALIGHVETGLTGGGEKKKTDEEADQQDGRQGDVPPSDLTQLLAQDFHVKCPRCRRSV